VYERNEAPQGPVDQRRSGPSPTLIALIVIAVVAVIFILQNGDSTQTNFLMLDFRAPKWVLLAITLAVGAVLDRLFMLWWRRRGRRNDD
jgi:uncharacterized integral membrane protein